MLTVLLLVCLFLLLAGNPSTGWDRWGTYASALIATVLAAVVLVVRCGRP